MRQRDKTPKVGWTGGVAALNPAVRAAYENVPWLERRVSGWIILRMLNRNPRRVRELERYGPRGAVGLARLRAVQVWVVILFVPIVAPSIAFGPPNAFWLLLAVIVVVGATSIFARRVANEGKRWRSDHVTD